jgi:hypothetical protein
VRLACDKWKSAVILCQGQEIRSHGRQVFEEKYSGTVFASWDFTLQEQEVLAVFEYDPAL